MARASTRRERRRRPRRSSESGGTVRSPSSSSSCSRRSSSARSSSISRSRLVNPDAYWDFHTFWRAGNAVLHGVSPYPPARASVLAHENSFVYPAPAALAMVPFALLPFNVSATSSRCSRSHRSRSPSASSASGTTAATGSRFSPHRSRTRWRSARSARFCSSASRCSGATAIGPGSPLHPWLPS